MICHACTEPGPTITPHVLSRRQHTATKQEMDTNKAPPQAIVPPQLKSVTGENPPSAMESEEEGGTPTEFHGVQQHAAAIASLGWGLLHKGAEVANSILSADGVERGLADVAKQLKEGTSADTEQPLETLRACKGYLDMLRRQTKTSIDDAAIPRVTAASFIKPGSVLQLNYSDELYQDCVWVEGSSVGQRIVAARKLHTSLVDERTGRRLEGAAILEVLPKFQQIAWYACNAVARIVMEELAEIFARPSRSLSSTLADLLTAHRRDLVDSDDRGAAQYWFLHHRNAVDTTWASFVSRNIMDLVAFAVCEMHHAVEELNRFGHECNVWANHEHRRVDSGIIEDVAASANAKAMLEESLAIVVSVFPQVEGTMPFEPIRIGQGIDYVRDDVKIVETECGTLLVAVGDRHDRVHHGEGAK